MVLCIPLDIHISRPNRKHEHIWHSPHMDYFHMDQFSFHKRLQFRREDKCNWNENKIFPLFIKKSLQLIYFVVPEWIYCVLNTNSVWWLARIRCTFINVYVTVGNCPSRFTFKKPRKVVCRWTVATIEALSLCFTTLQIELTKATWEALKYFYEEKLFLKWFK